MIQKMYLIKTLIFCTLTAANGCSDKPLKEQINVETKKDVLTTNKLKIKPVGSPKVRSDKQIPQKTRIEQLKGFYSQTLENDSALWKMNFFEVFPNSFNEFNSIYGYKKENNSFIESPLYESAPKHILELFNTLAPVVGEDKFYRKVLNLSINGKWYADAVSIMRRNLVNLVEKKPEYLFKLLEDYDKDATISIWRFYFDGPPYSKKNIPPNIELLKDKYPNHYSIITEGLKLRNSDINNH